MIRKLWIDRDRTTVPEKYKENFNVSSIKTLRLEVNSVARNVKVLLVFFR
jgi:hypothetical protein